MGRIPVLDGMESGDEADQGGQRLHAVGAGRIGCGFILLVGDGGNERKFSGCCRSFRSGFDSSAVFGTQRLEELGGDDSADACLRAAAGRVVQLRDANARLFGHRCILAAAFAFDSVVFSVRAGRQFSA
jgi:hypothetical protein